MGSRILPILLAVLLVPALTGCGAQVNTAFAGVALAGLLLVMTLGVLNYVARTRDSRRAQLIRTVVIALLLCSMIAMLVLIVLQSGIGRI